MSENVVETAHGRVRGVVRGSHVAFLGLRYAQPPTGTRRFAAPVAPEPWAGVQEASGFGLACPQPPSVLPGMEPGPQGEDCLFLNVYVPRGGGSRRPVLVWFHGGGFSAGSAAQAIYDGGPLATRGDAVVVTVNYRLGPLGFLHLPALGVDVPGAVDNPGLLDQLAALAWVRDNAAAFGGDPGNVTIFGESAGGMSVTTLITCPAARGIVRRAIAQSGAAQATLDRESAARTAHALLEELGLSPAEAARLRDVPVEQLVQAGQRVTTRLTGELFLAFAPLVDGTALPVHPLDALRAGAARDVALMTGTTADEWRLFTFAAPGHRTMDEAALVKRIARRLGRLGQADGAGSLIELYRRARPGAPPWQLFDAIESDRMFRIPAIRLAEAHGAHQPATFMYLFAWPSPAAGGRLGACHAIELPFVFGTLGAPHMERFSGSGPAAERLSEQVMGAWLAFAHDGVPAAPGLGPWPAYERGRRATMVLDAESRVIEDPGREEREAWTGWM